jgi:hypothetical protein
MTIWYFCGQFGILVANLVFLWPIWYFCGQFGIFTQLGLFYHEKSGNPAADQFYKRIFVPMWYRKN